MPLSTVAAVRSQIKGGIPDPIYLLQGEDDVEKSALAHEFEELVDEGLRPFNVDRLHFGQVTTGDQIVASVGALDEAVRTLPMMSPRRVVVVLQAEGILAPKRESEAATRALDALERVIKSPESQTTVVFVAAPLDKRGRMYRLLSKQAVIVECGVIADLADAERWIRNRISAGGMQIDAAGSRLLAARCGTDVKRLRSEVERLLLYALGQKTISLEDVRQVAGPSALQDDWAMVNAIEAGDAREALRQLALMMDAGEAPEKVLGQIGWLVRARLNLKPAPLTNAVDAIFRTDLDLKSSAGRPDALLERLVIELCVGKQERSGRGFRL